MIVGLLETCSKYKFGFTKHGTPLYLFRPFDKNLKSMIVGCNEKNLLQNYIVLVDKVSDEKGNLNRILGPAGNWEVEKEALIWLYCTSNRKNTKKAYNTILNMNKGIEDLINLSNSPGSNLWQTFNIDPQNCTDIDDCISYKIRGNILRIAITIADVAELVNRESDINKIAYENGQTVYTGFNPNKLSMLPMEIEKQCSLIPNQERRGLSLFLNWHMDTQIFDTVEFAETLITNSKSYTYENCYSLPPEIQNFLCSFSGSNDSHKWIESLMIFYNKQSAKLLYEYGTGIFRKNSTSSVETQELYQKYCPYLYYETSQFCNFHSMSEFKNELYCNTTSPIRRYIDLENQRLLKHILKFKTLNIPPGSEPCKIIHKINEPDIEHFNENYRNIKRYNRDLLFIQTLQNLENVNRNITGIVLEIKSEKLRVYILEWKKLIQIHIQKDSEFVLEQKLNIRYFFDMTKINWKHKIVFEIV